MKHKHAWALPALFLATLAATSVQLQNPRHQEGPQSSPSLSVQNLSADVQEAWVRHYASGVFPGEDAATAVAVDDAGNVFVTGSSEHHPFGIDFFTAKYDGAGNQIWAARYREGKALDYARAIAVDNSGNVYVTGSSDEGTGALEDYATIKYNAAGVEQWVARYNSPENLSDVPAALVVDGFGNVYVTGAIGALTVSDYLTVKYDASGNQQWVARYAGPVGRDNAVAIGVDGSGNVFVTGTSAGSGTSNDYAIIKYNALGVEQWVVRYNGPGNSFEEARGLVLDAAANVYVTGRSVGSGTQADYATINYDSSGAEQWVARYNGPGGNRVDEPFALAVDVPGNVYVTGGSIGSSSQVDYATVKYNASGIEQWVARYNGSGNAEDKAVALAIDGAGNVYVTGESGAVEDYATVKYDASGVEQWVARYNGPANSNDVAAALGIDGSGNVCVTGRSQGSNTGTDFATVRYDASGVEQWSMRYNGPGNSDNDASAIAVDRSGNIYVAGRSTGSNRKTDYATVKYNASGVEQWRVRYNGPGDDDDSPGAGGSPVHGSGYLAVDASGNVYVTGSSTGAGTGFDYATIKYNASGVEEWVARYNGPGNAEDRAAGLAVDAFGNVYVTGGSEGAGTGSDFATIKYNASGAQQWVARYEGPGDSNAGPGLYGCIAVDASGNVYVTGTSQGSGTGVDFTTIKYNFDGVERWVARYNTPGNSNDNAFALVIDGSGNVYVTGAGPVIGAVYATVKYDAAGSQQWVARYPSRPTSEFGALTVDGAGNVYMTASIAGSGMGFDITTFKNNSAGVEQWMARYNGPSNGQDGASALAIDRSGNVYVTGFSGDFGPSSDYVTVKYNSSGVEQWVALHDGPGSSGDLARALAIDNAGNVYVTGTSDGQNTSYSVYTTIKYDQTTVSVEEQSPSQPGAFWLSQNYPNPFNPTTIIRYEIPKPGHVTLKVFNLAGQEVATLVSEKKLAGGHEVEWNAGQLPSGVYVYHLQVGEFGESRKLVLIR